MKKITAFICAVLIAFLSGVCTPVCAQTQGVSVSEVAVNLIEAFEGYSKYAQWSYKQWVIGYGTVCKKNSYPDGITEKQADKLLRQVLPSYTGYLNAFINKHDIKLTQNQYDSLVSFTYNFGNVWARSENFKLRSYLIKGISKYSDEKITAAFTNWSKAGGVVLDGLLARRKSEAALFLTPDAKPDDEIHVVMNSVVLRSGAGVSYAKKGSLNRGDVIHISAKNVVGSTIWGKTASNGVTGWASLDYMKYAANPAKDSSAPDIPVIMSAANTQKGVKIRWYKDAGAKGYRVYRKEVGGKWTMQKQLKSTALSWTDTAPKDGVRYYYSVTAFSGKTESGFFKGGIGIAFISPPKLNGCFRAGNGLTVKWKKHPDAGGYHIMRREKGGSFKQTATLTLGKFTEYTDFSAKSGVEYFYSVRAFNADSVSGYITPAAAGIYLAAPYITVTPTETALKLSWEPVGAKSYTVHRKMSKKSKAVKHADTTGTVFVDKKVSSKTTYYYTVTAQLGSLTASSEVTAVFVSAPSATAAANAAKGVRISWKPAENVSGYTIYRKSGGGEYAKLRSVAGAQKKAYTDKTAQSGVKYSYTVCAYHGPASSARAAKSATVLYLSRPVISAKAGKNGITLSWGKVGGSTGYYVERKIKGGKYETIATQKSRLKFTDTTPKSGTEYFYRIRAYSGRYISAASAAASCTITE